MVTIAVDGTMFRVPDGVSVDMLSKAMAANWTPSTSEYLSRRAARTGEVFPMDRFTKTISAHESVYQLCPIIRSNGQLSWQIGLRFFVDYFYPEYCHFFDTVEEALAHKLR